MSRNLDNRIEVGVPIWDENLKKILQTMLDIQWRDNTKARLLGENNLNHYKSDNKDQLNSQEEIYKYFKSQFIDNS
jgi:polyphosphate kinase